MGGFNIDGAPVFAKGKGNMNSKADAFIPGNYCSGPTVADVENDLAMASLSREAGDENVKKGNVVLTWKRWA